VINKRLTLLNIKNCYRLNLESTATLLLLTLLLTYFIKTSLYAIIDSEGWVLNQQIAFADRIINEGLARYTEGSEDLFITSSPYFPGVGYIAYIIKTMGIESNLYLRYIMLTISSLISLTLVAFLAATAKEIKTGTTFKTNIILVSLLFIYSVFSYKTHSLMFKSDPLIIISSLACFIVFNRLKNQSVIFYLFYGTLLFLSAFLKQQAIFVYFCYFSLVLFDEENDYTQKIKRVVFGLSLGLIFIGIISNTNGLIEYTVKRMSLHGYYPYNVSIEYIKDAITYCLPLVFLIAIGIFITFYKTKSDRLRKVYFLCGLVWLIICLLGLAKSGGNRANLETAFVWFIPFALNGIHFSATLVSRAIPLKFTKQIVLTTIYITILFNVYQSFIKINELKVIHEQRVKSIQWLVKNFENRNAIIESSLYVITKDANIIIKSDIDSIKHYFGDNLEQVDLSEVFNCELGKLIIVENENTIKVLPTKTRQVINNNFSIVTKKPNYINFDIYESKCNSNSSKK